MRRITITDRDTATSLRRKLASKEHEYCKILIKHKHIDLVLSCFRTNRSPAQAHINKFVKKHLTGEFRDDSLLHADKAGYVANGMHRLYAQKKTEVDQEYEIKLGLTEKDVQEIDEGIRQRTPKDRLKVSKQRIIRDIVGGEAQKAKVSASILSNLYHILTHETNMDSVEELHLFKYFQPDIKWILSEAAPAKLLNKSSVLVPTLLACRYARKNGQWDDFTDAVARLKSGENLSGILLAMREYIISFHKHYIVGSGGKRVQSRKPKDTRWIQSAKLLRGWQIFLSGEPYRPGVKKAKLQMVADYGKLLEWFLEENRSDLIHTIKLRPLRLLMDAPAA